MEDSFQTSPLWLKLHPNKNQANGWNPKSHLIDQRKVTLIPKNPCILWVQFSVVRFRGVCGDNKKSPYTFGRCKNSRLAHHLIQIQCESRRSQSEKDSHIDRFGMPQTKFKLKRNNKNQLPSPPNWFMLYIFIYSFIHLFTLPKTNIAPKNGGFQ